MPARSVTAASSPHQFALDDVNDALDLMRSGTSERILLNIS
ncbi:hypothetical protein [Bradyrhizobium guangxiense]|nr:hypothetical protein [Bradyrhizobium guangxiense]